MLRIQEQPSLDSPAIEQAPMVERVVEGAKNINPRKRRAFWPVVFSYILSVGTGVGVAYLINFIFGSPYTTGLIQFDSTIWRLGIPLSIIIAFILGLFLPVLFARGRRFKVIFYTIFLQFVTLVALVILGLTQLSGLV